MGLGLGIGLGYGLGAGLRADLEEGLGAWDLELGWESPLCSPQAEPASVPDKPFWMLSLTVLYSLVDSEQMSVWEFV